MIVTAHSGAFGTPDNSIEYVKKVIEAHCAIFEIDVTFRPDGTPVVIHSGAPGENEGVLLRDVFTLAAADPAIRMNLDLKSMKNLPAVDALLEEFGLAGRAFYTGVTAKWVETVKRSSRTPYYLNAGVFPVFRGSVPALLALADRVKRLGALGINTHYSNCTPAMVKAFRKKGLEISVWTVNDEENAAKYVAMDVDNITTRHPDLLAEAIRRRG